MTMTRNTLHTLLLCAALPLLADDNCDRLRREQHEFLDNMTSIFEVGSCAITGLERTLSCRVLYADRDIVSYRLENYNYSGGAHGNSTIAVGTYGRGCLARGRLTLRDIAPTRADYSRLTALLRWEAQRQFKVKTYQELRPHLFGDLWPVENFYFDDKGLHVVYNEYDIAAFACGVIELCVRWPLPACVKAAPQMPTPDAP
ncbi:MAG: DUF3298 domain-containing protein [Oligosphaeraceae bacterium]